MCKHEKISLLQDKIYSSLAVLLPVNLTIRHALHDVVFPFSLFPVCHIITAKHVSTCITQFSRRKWKNIFVHTVKTRLIVGVRNSKTHQ